MRFLIHKELADYLDEVRMPINQETLLNFLRVSDVSHPISVSFTADNSFPVDINDDLMLLEHFDMLEVNITDTILISTLVCDGFINTMKGFTYTFEKLITGHK